ncbi:MAG: flagellar hook-basal body complex protein [Planctomycetota bacterium]
MASTTALYTGLSGLNANSRRLDVIGNNITNVNTVAFKGSRLTLASQFTSDFKLGAAPSQSSGGTNPGQIGLGVGVVGTQRDFRIGSLSPTGDPRDLAIDGPGLFIVRSADDDFYTRNGGFRVDRSDQLVTAGGDVLLGYGIDDDFNVQAGAIEPLTVPIGKLSIAEPTTRIAVAGNLNAGGPIAQSGGVTELRVGPSAGLSVSSTAATAIAPDVVQGASLLTDIIDPAAPIPDTPLFTVGQKLQSSGVQRGGKVLPDVELEITAATTVDELLGFLAAAGGINQTGLKNPDGGLPGAEIDPATGVISVIGNTGSVADLSIESTDIRLVNADGSLAKLPFIPTNSADAGGESVRTTLVAYDSLGNLVTFDIAFTLEQKTGGNGTTWRYDIFSEDNRVAPPAPPAVAPPTSTFVQSGTISFDAVGRATTTAPIAIALGRDGTGAQTPLSFSLEFVGSDGEVTALTDTPSDFGGVARDGLPAGTLERFSVQPDGIIQGTFGNGAIRPLGQVAMADFTNPEGLIDIGGGLFRVGANSGQAVVDVPGSFGTGEIISGVLELSNVDLGQEFIDLILTNTGYSASSRVIQTADELIQQLLLLAR